MHHAHLRMQDASHAALGRSPGSRVAPRSSAASARPSKRSMRHCTMARNSPASSFRCSGIDDASTPALSPSREMSSRMDFMIRSYLDRVGETVAREWLKKAGATELQVLLKYTTERSLK